MSRQIAFCTASILVILRIGLFQITCLIYGRLAISSNYLINLKYAFQFISAWLCSMAKTFASTKDNSSPTLNVREDEHPKTISPHSGVSDAENTALVRHRRVVVTTMFQKDTTSQTKESLRLAAFSNDASSNYTLLMMATSRIPLSAS